MQEVVKSCVAGLLRMRQRQRWRSNQEIMEGLECVLKSLDLILETP